MTKKIIHTLFLIIFEGLFQHVFSQSIVDSSKTADSIIACGHSYEAPVFIDGGTTGMNKFLMENIKGTDQFEYTGGSVMVRFDVDTLGNVQNVVMVRGSSPALCKELVRVVSLMKFYPAKENGKLVPAQMHLPVHIHWK